MSMNEQEKKEYYGEKARHDYERDMLAGQIKCFEVIVKSHCDMPDFETQIFAKDKQEAIAILRKSYDYEFTEDDLMEVE